MNPRIMEIYQKEYMEKLKYDNACSWRNGMYVYEALVSSLSGAFGSKSSKKITYPKEPHRILPMTEEEKKEIEERERKKAIAFFNAMEKSANKNNQES